MTRRLLPLLLLVACDGAQPPATTPAANVFLVGQWHRRTIEVCFENRADAKNAALIVEATAEAVWDEGSALELTGWTDCTPAAPGLHVRFGSATAVTRWADALDGLTDGVTIDTDPCVGPCYVTQREDLIRLHTVLAFAQALGIGEPREDEVDAGYGTDAGHEAPPPASACVDGDVVVKCEWPAELTVAAQDLRFARFGGNVGALYAGGGSCLGLGEAGQSVDYARCTDGLHQRWPHPYVWQPPQFHMWLQASNGLCARPLGTPSLNQPIIGYECGGASWTLSPTGSLEGPAAGWLRGVDGCVMSHGDSEQPYCTTLGRASSYVLDGPGLLGFSILTEDRTACLMPVSLEVSAPVRVRPCELDDPAGKWFWRDAQLHHTISGLCMAGPGPILAPCDGDLLDQHWAFTSHLALDGTDFCLRHGFLVWCPGKVDPSEEAFTYTP